MGAGQSSPSSPLQLRRAGDCCRVLSGSWRASQALRAAARRAARSPWGPYVCDTVHLVATQVPLLRVGGGDWVAWRTKDLLIFLLQIPGCDRKGITMHNSHGKHKAGSWSGREIRRRRKASGAGSKPATAGGTMSRGAKLRTGWRGRERAGAVVIVNDGCGGAGGHLALAPSLSPGCLNWRGIVTGFVSP